MQRGRWQEPMSHAGSDLRSEAIGIRFPISLAIVGKKSHPVHGSGMLFFLWLLDQPTPLWIGLQAELHPTRSCPHGGVVEDTGTVQHLLDACGLSVAALDSFCQAVV